MPGSDINIQIVSSADDLKRPSSSQPGTDTSRDPKPRKKQQKKEQQSTNKKETEKKKTLNDIVKAENEVLRLQVQRYKLLAAEESALGVLGRRRTTQRRRFINDVFGAAGRAHGGRRFNHLIDAMRGVFGITDFIGAGAKESPLSGIGRALGFSSAGGAAGRGVVTASLASGAGATPPIIGGGAGAAGGAAAGGGALAGLGAGGIATGGALLALAAVIGGTVLAFYAVEKGANKLAKELANVPGPLLVKKADIEIQRLERNIRRAEQFGPDLAEREQLKADVGFAFQDIKDLFQDDLLQISKAMLKTLGDILEALKPIFEAIDVLIELGVIDYLSEVIGRASPENAGQQAADLIKEYFPMFGDAAQKYVDDYKNRKSKQSLNIQKEIARFLGNEELEDRLEEEEILEGGDDI